MRKLTLSILASAAAIAAPASAQTVTVGQGPNLPTHISASTSDTTNNSTTVFGSTTGVGGSDVVFTGNTQIHITDGNGFAALSDSTNAADTGVFTSLIINPAPAFTALEFNLSFDTASYLQVDYSYGGGLFTNAGTFEQSANANTGYTITSGATSFDAIRLTSCATAAICNTAVGVGSGTGGAINFERQNSLNLSVNGPTVPEPATWAMMLVGFGAAGVSLRRRRKVTALQAA